MKLRFEVVSDLPEWSVFDNVLKVDLFPTLSGNRKYACSRCDEDTARRIADALNQFTASNEAKVDSQGGVE